MQPYGLDKLGIFVATLALVAGAATVCEEASAQQYTVFVHGLGQNQYNWDALAGDLAARHPLTPLKPTLGSQNPYSSQAAVLWNYLDSWGVNNIAAISHSNGGGVVREYTRVTLSQRINRHLSLGTPHRGAELARSIWNGTLGTWIWDTGYQVLNPIFTYAGDDPDWDWLFFDGGSTFYLESMAFSAYDVVTSVLPAALAGALWAPRRDAQYRPGRAAVHGTGFEHVQRPELVGHPRPGGAETASRAR